MTRLFIDDVRFPEADGDGNDWDIVRSSAEAILYVTKYGVPNYISLDHDLGGDDTSIVFINWLTDRLIDGDEKLPQNFAYAVHSQNPVGAENIRSKMNQILLHFGGYY